MRKILIFFFAFISTAIYSQNNYATLYNLKTVNQNLATPSLIKLSLIDPVEIPSQHHSALNLGGQFFVGSALAFAFFLPAAVIGYASAWNRSTDLEETSIGIFMISSYLFGATVGVHWIAKAENKNLSFWKTAAYSVIGGSFSALLIAIVANKYTTIPSSVIYIAAAAPVLGAMFYSSFISDWSSPRNEALLIDNDITHLDFIEHSKVFNIELFHVRL